MHFLARLWDQMTDTATRRVLLVFCTFLGPVFWFLEDGTVRPYWSYSHRTSNSIAEILTPGAMMLAVLAVFALLELLNLTQSRWKDRSFVLGFAASAIFVLYMTFSYRFAQPWAYSRLDFDDWLEMLRQSHLIVTVGVLGLWGTWLVAVVCWRFMFGKRSVEQRS
ncbi:hypothetical protein [Aureimonas sp. AU40]|uniref:hypothetical protein n=1 Tax=Aureimonas sp. AU40 TaxID=1637747 RepID=UPI00078276D7|nr:hypothetical protein [Aureimonas sp. AU40]